MNTRDRIQNIIQAVHSKEDEIYESLIGDYEINGIRKHGAGSSIFDQLGLTSGLSTIENLSILEAAIANDSGLQKYAEQLISLLGVKVSAMEKLVTLQEGYAKFVEPNDAAVA